MKSRFAIIVLVCALTLGATAPGWAAITVSPSNMNGWATYTTDSSGIVGTASAGVVSSFAVPPAAPPLGSSSAYLTTGTGQGDQSAQFRTALFAGTRIDALTALSYSTYASSWNGQQLPYLTIWLDNDGNGSRDDRLWFEPDYSQPGQPAAALGTWQTWNALTGKWYSDSGIGTPGAGAITLATYLAAEPNATIINDAFQGIGGFRIASGFASPEDNFTTYFDNLTFATALGSETYNFEMDAAVPEPTSLVVWSLIALTFGGARWWRRRKSA